MASGTYSLSRAEATCKTGGGTLAGRPPAAPVQTGQMTTRFDYDRDRERFRLAARLTQRHLTASRSLYQHLADVLAGLRPRRILDVGCGEGALHAALPAQLRAQVVGLDASAAMLSAHPPPVLQADATALPFPAGTFGASPSASCWSSASPGSCPYVGRWAWNTIRDPVRIVARSNPAARSRAPSVAGSTTVRSSPTW
jgi:SAM-dependent methyltransferase